MRAADFIRTRDLSDVYHPPSSYEKGTIEHAASIVEPPFTRMTIDRLQGNVPEDNASDHDFLSNFEMYYERHRAAFALQRDQALNSVFNYQDRVGLHTVHSWPLDRIFSTALDKHLSEHILHALYTLTPMYREMITDNETEEYCTDEAMIDMQHAFAVHSLKNLAERERMKEVYDTDEYYYMHAVTEGIAAENDAFITLLGAARSIRAKTDARLFIVPATGTFEHSVRGKRRNSDILAFTDTHAMGIQVKNTAPRASEYSNRFVDTFSIKSDMRAQRPHFEKIGRYIAYGGIAAAAMAQSWNDADWKRVIDRHDMSQDETQDMYDTAKAIARRALIPSRHSFDKGVKVMKGKLKHRLCIP